jgi:hypothetical protein
LILHGNQRGGGRDLAAHLMKAENERIEIVEMRGFVAENLRDALVESYAISKATRCKQHLFSLSINPPSDADINSEDYLDAADRVEKELGLTGQARALVRHWKRGQDGVLRSHAHVVWCRIDTERMKAVHLPFTKKKLREVSRDLHLKHEIKMPPGLINSNDRNPRNFTLEQWQQCKRAKKDIRKLQEDFRDSWSISDSAAAFAHALEERGYILAKGSRGHVAVDYKGVVYAVRTYTGKTSKEVRQKLGSPEKLPSLAEAHAKASQQVVQRLSQLRAEQRDAITQNRKAAKTQSSRLSAKHQRQMEYLREQQERQKAQEEENRQSRFRKGFSGFWDWLTGKRKRTLLRNREEAVQIASRRREELRSERDHALVAMKVQHEKSRKDRLKHFEAIKELRGDMAHLNKMPDTEQGKPPRKRESVRSRRSRAGNWKGPSLDR